MLFRKRKPTLKVLFVDLDTLNTENLLLAIKDTPIAVVHRRGSEPCLIDLGVEVKRI